MYSKPIVQMELVEYNNLLQEYEKMEYHHKVLEKIIAHCKENERYIGNEGVKQILREANLY